MTFDVAAHCSTNQNNSAVAQLLLLLFILIVYTFIVCCLYFQYGKSSCDACLALNVILTCFTVLQIGLANVGRGGGGVNAEGVHGGKTKWGISWNS